MTPNPSTLKLNHTGKGIHVIILGLFDFLAGWSWVVWFGALLEGNEDISTFGVNHWILQNQMLSNKLGLNKDPEPPVTIWIEAATSLLKDKTASLQHQQISIGDHNMTTSQSQTEAECIIIGEFIRKKTHFKWKNSDFFTYSCANEAAYLQMPGIWLHGKKRITLLRVIPTMTCWVEVVRWGLSLRIWWEEWRIWEHWFQVSLA